VQHTLHNLLPFLQMERFCWKNGWNGLERNDADIVMRQLKRMMQTYDVSLATSFAGFVGKNGPAHTRSCAIRQQLATVHPTRQRLTTRMHIDRAPRSPAHLAVQSFATTSTLSALRFDLMLLLSTYLQAIVVNALDLYTRTSSGWAQLNDLSRARLSKSG
jgi:hypothetical protein